MIRFVLFLLALGVALTQYQLWFGRFSVARLDEVEANLEAQRSVNMKLREGNEALFAELSSLENRRDAIEEKARRSLNMVRRNELLFRIATPQTEEQYDKEPLLNLPDIQTPEIESGAEPTFKPNKSDLYSAPSNVRAPKARNRRE